MTKENKDEGTPIEVKTIGSGEMKKAPSWSDINTLICRIESLEHERGHHFENTEDDVDDDKENTSSELPELRRRSSAKPRGLARMLMPTKSQKAAYNEQLEEVERKYDEFELPESTYTFLITEPILSTPFFLGCISYALVSSSLFAYNIIYHMIILSIASHISLSIASSYISLCRFLCA